MENIDNRDAQIESVTIFGREYFLRSGESTEYTQKISAFVDRKMAEIADQLNTGEATKAAIMVALDIAGQLIREKDQRETNTERAMTALKRLGQYLDRIEDEKEEIQ
jgi:cell division protein ZapA (FtsZ GTPase activity inhibitor)